VSKKILAATMALLIAGCAQAPSISESMISAGASSPSDARVYFIRQADYGGMLVDYPFEIDNVGSFEIPYGSFFYIDMAPGDYVIRTSAPMLPGEYVLRLKATSQGIYYVKIDSRRDSVEANFAGSFAGGPLVGWIVQAAEAKENNGPFTLTPLPAEEAKPLMKTLKFRKG